MSKSSSLSMAKKQALIGLCVGDSLAMPVHWFYNPFDIKKEFRNWISDYQAAPQKHPTCILGVSSIGGSGRAESQAIKKEPVIGRLILHDKLQYWTSGDKCIHYHRGMKAGDSTLNTMCALNVAKTLQREDPEGLCQNPRALRAAVLEDYVTFMTTPGSHEDTYAESFHRLLFRDWDALETPPRDGQGLLEFLEKRALESVEGPEDKQLTAIGALVMAVPWVLHTAALDVDTCSKAAVDFVKLTHPVASMERSVEVYARTLHAVLRGGELGEEALKAVGDLKGDETLKRAREVIEDAEKDGQDWLSRLETMQGAAEEIGMACYTPNSLVTALVIAAAFPRDFEGGLFTNVNVGGENCHRGAALGALLGAAAAASGQPPRDEWRAGLRAAAPLLGDVLSREL